MAIKGRNRHLDGLHKIGRGTLKTCDMSRFGRQLTTQKSSWARDGHRSKSWFPRISRSEQAAMRLLKHKDADYSRT